MNFDEQSRKFIGGVKAICRTVLKKIPCHINPFFFVKILPASKQNVNYNLITSF